MPSPSSKSMESADIFPIIALCVALAIVTKMFLFKNDPLRLKFPGTKSISELPRPPGLPLLGNTIQLLRHGLLQMHTLFREWTHRYGDTYVIALEKTYVVLSNYKDVKSVLDLRPGTMNRDEAVCDPVYQSGFTGVFVQNGDQWKRHRRLTSPAVSHGNIKTVMPKINTVARGLVKKWSTLCNNDTTKVFNCKEDCSLFALDVGCLVVTGYTLNTLQGASGVGLDILSIMNTVYKRTANPFPFWKVLRDTAFDKAAQRYDALVLELIAKERARLAAAKAAGTSTATSSETATSSAASSTSLLTHLLQVQEGPEGGSSGRNALTVDELLGNLKMFLVAGADTVGGTLAWLFYDLGLHQHVQEKLRHEITTVLQTDTAAAAAEENVNADVTWEQVNALPYADAVISESLRTHHPAQLIFSTATKDCQVAGITIPKGVGVVACQATASQNAHNFSEPDRYWPERWLIAAGTEPLPDGYTHINSNDNSSNNNNNAPATVGTTAAAATTEFIHNSNAVRPFGCGGRKCPGMGLALVDIKVALATLLKEYRVTLKAGHSVPNDQFALGFYPDAVHIAVTKL